MSPRALRLPMCAVALLLSAATGRADPLLKVAEVRWTSAVTDGQYGETYDQMAPLQPIYLWMRVEAKQAALDQLRAAGKLPIRHRWFKVVGTSVRYEQSTDAISLSIGNDQKLQPLLVELMNRGFFDWRTWSMKDHVSPGWWRVRLEYATGQPVLCGADLHPCEFDIDIE